MFRDVEHIGQILALNILENGPRYLQSTKPKTQNALRPQHTRTRENSQLLMGATSITVNLEAEAGYKAPLRELGWEIHCLGFTEYLEHKVDRF